LVYNFIKFNFVGLRKNKTFINQFIKMKKIFTLFLFTAIVFAGFAQENDKSDKKADKEKKEKSAKSSDKQSKDDAIIFIGEPEDGDYSLESRREISTPSMPMYNVEQEFNKGKKKRKQQEAFMNNEYYFPAKPKNAWQLGVRGGISMLNGDINQNFFKGAKPFVPGYTFGASVVKPFSYLFSIRLNYDFMEMWNTDWQPSTLTAELIRHSDYALANYVNDNPNGGNVKIFNNSHTIAHDMTFDAVFTVGNLRYHKERTKVVFNFFATMGGFMYQTWYDHLDANGDPYDYRSIPDINTNPDVSKAEVIQALETMRNGVYETPADGHPNSKNPTILNNYSFRPTGGVGMGMSFRLSRVVNLDLQARMMFTKDDLMDGVRWEEPAGNNTVAIPASQGGGQAPVSRGLTGNYDSYTNTTLGLTFKLVGKNKTESTTLLNPLHYSYQKIAENDPEKAIEELLKDDDDDGVPNRMDEEPDTPEGAPVNPKGIALDSDKDGVIDLYDEEPFSVPGLPVTEKGVAIVPIVEEACQVCDCENVVLPSIHFDKDKYNIRPEFYAHLHSVAAKLNVCPDLRVRATGMTDKDDSNKYNEQLSWNRVNEVIEFLTENYGIDRTRFIVLFEGEANATGTSSFEQYRERKVTLEQAEPGEVGDSNPPAPHPNVKAGSKE